MDERHAFALHGVDAERGGVEQDVHKMIGQQVDFIDIEDAAMRRGEEAGLEGASSFPHRPLQIERAEDAVLGGADRQIDEGDRDFAWRMIGRRAAGRAVAPDGGGIAVVGTAGDYL